MRIAECGIGNRRRVPNSAFRISNSALQTESAVLAEEALRPRPALCLAGTALAILLDGNISGPLGAGDRGGRARPVHRPATTGRELDRRPPLGRSPLGVAYARNRHRSARIGARPDV